MTSKFQRRHYKSLARWVSVHAGIVQESLIFFLKHTNENFNEDIFRQAIEENYTGERFE